MSRPVLYGVYPQSMFSPTHITYTVFDAIKRFGLVGLLDEGRFCVHTMLDRR